MESFFQSLVGILTPVFVVSQMANVGLTQQPQKILQHLKKRRFLLRMLIANFIVVPALMYFAVGVTGIEHPYATRLVIFSLVAGAPLLIKLTAKSRNDISAGATVQMVQMVLMVATIGVLPLALPRVLDGVSVSAWAIAQPLLLQMLLPLALGMVVAGALTTVAAAIQPWIARLSTIALYGMLISTVLGHLSALTDLALWGALALGILVLLLAFLIGHGMGDNSSSMSDIGGLGTAQRNTAAGIIAARSGFPQDPLVFVTVAMLNTLMMFVLLAVASHLRSENRPAWLEPMAADPPQKEAKKETA